MIGAFPCQLSGFPPFWHGFGFRHLGKINLDVIREKNTGQQSNTKTSPVPEMVSRLLFHSAQPVGQMNFTHNGYRKLQRTRSSEKQCSAADRAIFPESRRPDCASGFVMRGKSWNWRGSFF